MANEFKVTATLTYTNGQLKYTYQPGTVQLPQGTQGFIQETITATSADTAISTTGLTTPSLMILQSLEPTTTGQAVDYSAQTSTGGIGNPTGTLNPKDIHILRLNSTSTLRVQNAGAAAGNTNLHLILFEA